MLQRINILLEEKTWKRVKRAAKISSKSTSDFVRESVLQRLKDLQLQKQRADACLQILKTRPTLKGKIDYKALVEEGRDYEGRGY